MQKENLLIQKMPLQPTLFLHSQLVGVLSLDTDPIEVKPFVSKRMVSIFFFLSIIVNHLILVVLRGRSQMTETFLFSPLNIYYQIASDHPIDEDSNLTTPLLEMTETLLDVLTHPQSANLIPTSLILTSLDRTISLSFVCYTTLNVQFLCSSGYGSFYSYFLLFYFLPVEYLNTSLVQLCPRTRKPSRQGEKEEMLWLSLVFNSLPARDENECWKLFDDIFL